MPDSPVEGIVDDLLTLALGQRHRQSRIAAGIMPEHVFALALLPGTTMARDGTERSLVPLIAPVPERA
ncbi:MAG TPA: hypothetical protein VF503_31800 [Sphingobium sp.]|uniref:hypothetical protein n=1 Tax=Sphingobium sp. TaxID=1912891 RepID=UPI002ECFDBE2